MSSLHDLEKDVYQFLNSLANVRRVEVEVSASRGKKRATVRTYVKEATRDNLKRVGLTEELLKDRHRNVAFDFHCSTLKEVHEQRTVGTP